MGQAAKRKIFEAKKKEREEREQKREEEERRKEAEEARARREAEEEEIAAKGPRMDGDLDRMDESSPDEQEYLDSLCYSSDEEVKPKRKKKKKKKAQVFEPETFVPKRPPAKFDAETLRDKFEGKMTEEEIKAVLELSAKIKS